jgi:cytochrome c-type biogenesis protein CcmH
MPGQLLFVLVALAVLLPLAWWVGAGFGPRVRALAVLAALLAAGGLYLAVGMPSQIAPALAPVDELTAKMEQRLDENPGDVEGWRMLGRLHVSQGRFDAGAAAYEKARALTGDEDAAALVGYAEARLLGDPGRLTGEVAPLLERALALAPDDPRALWYGGHLAAEQGDRVLAEQRWRALLAQPVPPELRRAIEAQLADLGADTATAAAPHAVGGGGGGSGRGAPLFELEVELAPKLAGRIPAGAPLFVFVREGTGRAPLVVRRVGEYRLPARFVLTDGDLLGPAEALAAAQGLTAGARIAMSGTASRGKGDLEGTVRIERGSPGRARVVIDTEVE